MFLGIILFVLGMFIMTQNTQSKISYPLIIVGLVLIASPVWGHDEDHSHDSWYSSLKQPDNPNISCCGLADAYWCDDYYARDGRAYCKITDDRDDAKLGRPHIEVGTEFEIPPYKLKWEEGGKPTGNPTGHAVIFVNMQGHVWCYVQGGGV